MNIAARLKQLEDCWPSGEPKPRVLTDEEYMGAPVHPSRDWLLRGPPLNEASWNKEIRRWETELSKWRAEQGK